VGDGRGEFEEIDVIRAILDVLHLGEVGAGLLDPLDVAFDGRVREYAEIQVEEEAPTIFLSRWTPRVLMKLVFTISIPEIGIQDDDGI